MESILNILYNMENNPTNALTKSNNVINEINKIFAKIKECKNFQESNTFFEILQTAQGIVSRLMFINKLTLPEPLIVFFRDFDRIDDLETRQIIYNLLKENKYSLAKSLRD